MKPKRILKISVDVMMTYLFLMQMGYHMLNNRTHEWLGVTLCCLFILHHVLNGGWHKGLLKGRYSAQRTLLTAVDALLTLAMVAIMISAVFVSRHVFDFLGLRMRALGRQIHLPATMWAFVLMGLHLGLHWSMILNMMKGAGGRKACRTIVWMGRIALAMISAFGVYQFIARGLYMEMFMLREFAFLDYGEPLLYFFGSYVAVVAALAAISHYIGKGIKIRHWKEKSSHAANLHA